MRRMDAATEPPPIAPARVAADACDAHVVIAPMTGEETDEPIDFALIEALFFAYRDFISSADRQLAAMGFGRAHHRVLHFVNRQPGLTVAELLEPLGITKQSLARVLRQLVEAGLVVQRQQGSDRRQRHLYPTVAGRRLTLDLAGPQSRRIARALLALGKESPREPREVARAFLEGMVEAPGNRAANGEP